MLLDINRFMVSALLLSFSIGLILAVKRLFRKHISVYWQYKIWYLVLFLLAVPFLPAELCSFLHIPIDLFSFLHYNVNGNSILHANGAANAARMSDMSWMNDFTVSVTPLNTTSLTELLFIIWFIGFILTLALFLLVHKSLSDARKNMLSADGKWNILLEECKQEMHIRKNISLGLTSVMKTPVIFGLAKPVILLPKSVAEKLSSGELRYILLHELKHYKNNDLLVNACMCMFQCIYWFHPFIWIIQKQMREERELACDAAVLRNLPVECHAAYGMTIIRFIEQLSFCQSFRLAAEMGATKNLMKRRIEQIASFTQESFAQKLKSMAVFALVLLVAITQTPIISAMVYGKQSDVYFDTNNSSIVYEDGSAYFDGFEGSYVLYDSNSEQYTVYNKTLSEKRVSPDSTYKIYSALIALDQGIISPEESYRMWDGTRYSIDAWNQDQTLHTAMVQSVNWYFQDLDRQTSFQTIKDRLNAMEYGNCDLSGGEGAFWLESSLKISPMEQVQILVKLYNYELNAKPQAVDAVKEAMKLSEQDGAVLSGKTGTGSVNGKTVNGWFIGFVEQDSNVIFFAVNIAKGEGGQKAAEIALSILKDKGIYSSITP